MADPFEELSESGKEACYQLLKIYKRANAAAVYPHKRSAAPYPSAIGQLVPTSDLNLSNHNQLSKF